MVKLIKIEAEFEGTFVSRPNRYLANVNIGGVEELVHVHDPGRLKELLYEGNKVLVRKASNPNRKTKYDMIAAKAADEWILVNSIFHRRISEAILDNPQINPIKKMRSYKAEVKYGKSRIDFLLETDKGKVWVETKGCTLSDDITAVFPDAPTERGRRHLRELIEINNNKQDRAAVFILVLREATYFEPNHITDIEFYKLFYEALSVGVKVYPILLEYKDKSIYFKKIIEIKDKNLKYMEG